MTRKMDPFLLRQLFLIICCGVLLASAGNAVEPPLEIRTDTAELQPILETALTLPSTRTDSSTLNPRWLKHYQRQLPGLVRETLEPYGYFYSETSSQLVENDSGEMRLQVDIRCGEPLRVTRRELDLVGPGGDLPELRRQMEAFPLQVGDVVRQDLYEQGKARLQQAAADRGYLQAVYRQHQLRVHLGERRVEIHLLLDTGPRFRFGATRFSGQEDYPQNFLRRFLAYRTDESFSYSLLGQTQLNLFDADLFRTITVRALPEQADNEQVPIEVALQPMPRHRLRPGIGYGTDTGGRVSLRYRLLNLLHRGHELQGDLLLAERKQSLLTTYVLPDMARLDSQTLLRIGFDREETESYDQQELFTEAEYQRGFGNNLLGTLFVRLTRETSDVSDDTTHSRMLLPGLRLAWKKTDAPLDMKKGLHAALKLQGAHEALFSDTSLVQLSGQLNLLQPLPYRHFLLLRLQGGATWHNDPIREMPASLRFFAGGDRSVRGYRYQSLGPEDSEGNVVGGKHLLVANLELEKRLNPQWGLALFYDVGNAFDNFSDYELEQGAGVGIRRYTRIGPLRLDLARRLGSDQGYRLHLSVGFGW